MTVSAQLLVKRNFPSCVHHSQKKKNYLIQVSALYLQPVHTNQSIPKETHRCCRRQPHSHSHSLSAAAAEYTLFCSPFMGFPFFFPPPPPALPPCAWALRTFPHPPTTAAFAPTGTLHRHGSPATAYLNSVPAPQPQVPKQFHTNPFLKIHSQRKKETHCCRRCRQLHSRRQLSIRCRCQILSTSFTPLDGIPPFHPPGRINNQSLYF